MTEAATFARATGVDFSLLRMKAYLQEYVSERNAEMLRSVC